MNCQQVDRLLYLYCDNQVQTHLRHDIEAHLQNCPACQNNLAMTEMENEALRYTGDVPCLDAAFCRKVMQNLELRYGSADHSLPNSRWNLKSFLSRGSNFSIAGGVVAVILLFFALVNPLTLSPVADSERQQYGRQPEGVPVAGVLPPNTSAKSANESVKEDAGAGKTEALRAPQPHDTDVIAVQTDGVTNPDRIAPRTALTTPGYTREETALLPHNRGKDIKFKLPMGGAEPFVPKPGYLPAGYTLTRVVNSLDNVLTLTYEGNGGQILIRVIPEGGEKVEEAPVLMEQKQREMNIKATGAGVAADGEVDIQAQQFPDPAVTDATTITWRVNMGEQAYKVEVTGGLPPEELARIAASCK